MNNGKIIFSFIAGAALSAAVSWRYFKTKYERIAQEEIDSIREYYRTTRGEIDEMHEHVDDNVAKAIAQGASKKKIVTEYADILARESYVEPSVTESMKKEAETMSVPYVIAPEEFGERDNYETISLTYYADGVLTDDFDEPIEDVEAIVGEESLTHFGEYEDDSVFVRNDKLKTDYEILADSRKYSDRFVTG